MFHQNKPFLQILFWVKSDFFLHIFAGLGVALCALPHYNYPNNPFFLPLF